MTCTDKDFKVEEQMMDDADLMAAADQASMSAIREEEDGKPMEDTEAVEAVKAAENRFEVPFSRGYQWDGKEISSIDLSGIEDLTGQDGAILDRILAQLEHAPANKFKDTTYTMHVAARVTGLPLEFFHQLQIRDMLLVTAKVYNYFLAG